jgi:hypothetical protein
MKNLIVNLKYFGIEDVYEKYVLIHYHFMCFVMF